MYVYKSVFTTSCERDNYQHYSNPHSVLNENNDCFKWRAQQEVEVACFEQSPVAGCVDHPVHLSQPNYYTLPLQKCLLSF